MLGNGDENALERRRVPHAFSAKGLLEFTNTKGESVFDVLLLFPSVPLRKSTGKRLIGSEFIQQGRGAGDGVDVLTEGGHPCEEGIPHGVDGREKAMDHTAIVKQEVIPVGGQGVQCVLIVLVSCDPFRTKLLIVGFTSLSTLQRGLQGEGILLRAVDDIL